MDGKWREKKRWKKKYGDCTKCVVDKIRRLVRRVVELSTYQILKLKLGPQDNNGMMEIYMSGINSPLSVLWRRSNVSGMLSFLKPLLICKSEERKREERERVFALVLMAKVLIKRGTKSKNVRLQQLWKSQTEITVHRCARFIEWNVCASLPFKQQ